MSKMQSVPFSTINPSLIQVLGGDPAVFDWGDLSAADWQDFLSQAQAQGVAPLLYWRLSKAGQLSSVPESARNYLRVAYASTWSSNQKLLHELETLARRFAEAGIELVVLKGACFALTVYADIGLRPMGDLDVLVPGEKLAQAVQIARALGFTDAMPEAGPGLNALLSHHVCLANADCVLEIHDSLVAEHSFVYAVPVAWFWEQTEALGGPQHTKYANVRMLTPLAQLLFAAAHAMLQHGGVNTPLRWFYDLDLLVRAYPERLDWELLLAQAARFEWGSALAAALTRCVQLFDTPIPQPVRERLTGLVDRHSRLVMQQQVRPATHFFSERQKLMTLTGSARLRFVLALVAPSPAYMCWRYKFKRGWLLPVWYGLRWAGILLDAVRSLFSLIQRLWPVAVAFIGDKK